MNRPAEPETHPGKGTGQEPVQTGKDPERERLLHCLDEVARLCEVPTIDEVWVFPTRRAGKAESTVVVVSAFDDEDSRRRVVTAHFSTRPGNGRKVISETKLTEHGIAPADRIGRLIEGVLRRLDEELASLPPRSARIQGDAERWNRFLADLA